MKAVEEVYREDEQLRTAQKKPFTQGFQRYFKARM